MELCLGTVQFGMPYGIHNKKPPQQNESIEMLSYAVENGITTIDTAQAYGQAEEVVGAFVHTTSVPRNRLEIITKLLPNILDNVLPTDYEKIVLKNLEGSLARLQTDYVDGYLLHSSRYAFQPAILDSLAKMKQHGVVKKVGISVYDPEEARAAIESGIVDMMQVPFNLFDQRMQQAGILHYAYEKNVEIHLRSAFLQGLLLADPQNIPVFLATAKPSIECLQSICSQAGISPTALALGYVQKAASSEKLVFGVRNMQQLQEDIAAWNQPLSNRLLEEASAAFQSLDHWIVMPSLWKKERT